MKKFTPNTFQCPNALVDQYAEILSGNAFKCLTIIIRKTRGWHKDSDAISHSSFKGMSTNTAKAALKELVGHGLINATTHPNRPATYSLTDFFDDGLSEIDTQCLSIIDTQDDSRLS
ncbi:MAG: replication protein, partial [Pseudomonadota bacterium]|nr:replication protein [Pseudomonadota bacterium]